MIQVEPLTREAFAPFGDVIEVAGARQFEINSGFTTRVHDLCQTQALGTDARVIVNFFLGRPRPLEVKMLEAHPYGSQAFIPLQPLDWWVVVAEEPKLDAVRVFRAKGNQGVNYRAGVWHHPLLVDAQQDFIVIDRDGDEKNLEEVFFDGSLTFSQ